VTQVVVTLCPTGRQWGVVAKLAALLAARSEVCHGGTRCGPVDTGSTPHLGEPRGHTSHTSTSLGVSARPSTRP